MPGGPALAGGPGRLAGAPKALIWLCPSTRRVRAGHMCRLATSWMRLCCRSRLRSSGQAVRELSIAARLLRTQARCCSCGHGAGTASAQQDALCTVGRA